MKGGIFLDRDGTLIRDVHYLKDPDLLECIDGVEDALKLIKKAGYLIFLHTNQSGITRGYYEFSHVHACNERMIQQLGLSSDFFSRICIAPEKEFSPDGYRKPSPKFEHEMISIYELQPEQCWMVGDKWIDVETGINSGMQVCLVKTGKLISEELEQKALEKNVPICSDLLEFVNGQLNLF